MNSLTSQKRKLVYLVAILLLLIPIIYLGLPSGGKTVANQGIPGGVLAELRRKHDLGESNLGDVDPSSLTMNLVLLGMRGIAVNQLWIQMDAAKTAKDWSHMREVTESIVKLQPHYEKVWDYNGWNLAWNTSAEWDAVPDRYHWVKEGAKFMLDGIARNEKSTELRFRAATILQKKIGIADESAFYRKYFISDPDPELQGKADPKVNPEGKDNFLVAYDWYTAAVKNENDFNVPQRVTDRTTFHAMPGRCLFDYAQALHKDGQFGEIARVAWADALNEWVNKFGKETLISPVIMPDMSRRFVKYSLEMTGEEIKENAANEFEDMLLRKTVDDFQKIVNYRYWRIRGQSESEPETAETHRLFYEAGEKYKQQNWRESLTLLESSMKGFERLLARYPELREEDTMIEECMLAVQMLLNIFKIEIGENPPQEFPLKSIWQEQLGRTPEIEKEFQRRYLLQSGK